MPKTPRLLPECNGDTTLLSLLGYTPTLHQRKFGMSQVFITMKKYFLNQLAVGVVDLDKKITAPDYKDFEAIKNGDNIVLKKHKERKHYLIVLDPAAEKFILSCAKKAEINPDKYGYKDEKYFIKSFKKENAEKNSDLKNFINSIIWSKKDSDIKKLKQWLEEILGEDF